MKSKSQKYKEAVERNFVSFKGKLDKQSPNALGDDFIAKHNVTELKTRIGIRTVDMQYDDELNTIILQAKKKVESNQKKK